MVRRPHFIALVACLPALVSLSGCAAGGGTHESALAQSLRSFDASLAALDKERRWERVDAQPVIAGALVDLRDALHEIERGSRGIEEHVGPEVRRGIDALAASAEQLRCAAAADRLERLREVAQQIPAQIEQVSGELRALRRTIRPFLRPVADDPDRLAGRFATDRTVGAVRLAGAVYAVAALGGLLAALSRPRSAEPVHPGRTANRVLFSGLLALGLAMATGGARPIATLASTEISMRTGDEACRNGIAKGKALDAALRAAAELERGAAGARRARGEHAAPAGPPARRDLVDLVRGGSRRMLLERAQFAESAETASLVLQRPAALPGVSEALARDVQDLSAQCVALSTSRGAADEARYYHALSRSYLDEQPSCSEPPGCDPAERRARRITE
jgi:hypothetical protein